MDGSQTPRPVTKGRLNLLIVVFAALLGAELYLANHSYLQPRALRERGVAVVATVTQMDQDRDLQYQFTVGARTFGPGAPLGLPPWAKVPEGTWEAALESRQLEVVYLPEDPSINRPKASLVRPPKRPLASALLGAVALVFLAGLVRARLALR